MRNRALLSPCTQSRYRVVSALKARPRTLSGSLDVALTHKTATHSTTVSVEQLAGLRSGTGMVAPRDPRTHARQKDREHHMLTRCSSRRRHHVSLMCSAICPSHRLSRPPRPCPRPGERREFRGELMRGHFRRPTALWVRAFCAAGRGTHQPRDRPGAVHHDQDRQGASEPRLPQARDHPPRPTPGRARHGRRGPSRRPERSRGGDLLEPFRQKIGPPGRCGAPPTGRDLLA
jgi:hypothetical protein